MLTGYVCDKGFWKYLFILTGLFSVFFIIIIQSRAVYLGLAVSMLLALMIMLLRYRRVFSKKNMITGLISLILLLAGLSIFYSSLDPVRKTYFRNKIPVWNYIRSYENIKEERAREKEKTYRNDLNHIPEFDYAEEYYENANLRLIFWQKSMCLVRSHPLLGVGAGNWRLAVPACVRPYNPEHTLKNYTYSQPHNEWIGFLSELGIPGLLLALAVFLSIPLIIFYRVLKPKSEPHVTAVLQASFITGFYIFAFFDFPFRRVEHLVVLFSLLAFLESETVILNKTILNVRRIPAIFFSVSFILILSFSILIGIERFKGEYYTARMFREERRNDQNVINYCKKAENAFYKITPNALPLDWFEGVAFYRTGDYVTATACFERAMNFTPYEVRLLNDYGISLYNTGKTGEGKSILLRSVYIDPFFDDPKFNLAAIYFQSGQKDSALFYVNQCRESVKKEEFRKEITGSLQVE